jgi:hypothetical protein
MLKTILPLISVVTLTLASSCDDNNLRKEEASYFPLENHSQWKYERFWMLTEDEKIVMDTMELHVAGDTLVEGLSYKIILNGDGSIEKLIRRDNAKYYGRHHEFYGSFSKEYLFLDTSLPVGGSWTHVKDEVNLSKTEYIIKEKNSAKIIGEKTYTDVIVVEVNYYQKDLNGERLWMTATHYYSKNVGLIFSALPPIINNTYVDTQTVLISSH